MLKNKVVVVSGGSSGIGKAAVLKCIEAQAKVVVHHAGTEQSADDVTALRRLLSDGESAAFVGGDISLPETSMEIVAVALRAFGQIDVLVSNAGICEFQAFLDVTPVQMQRHMSVNYNGTFYLVQACAEQMKKQGHGGSIISVSSISALVGGGEQAHYTPTKAAILSLMQSCAVALGPFGIRCNAVLPGTIRTGMNAEDLKNDKKREYMSNRCALKRLGTPEDLAGPIVFLASDMSAYVTGAQLLVDGGLFVNLQ